jgi:hypothetical protein
MSIESRADWEGLRQVADVARVTLDTLVGQVRAGVTTGELDATAVRLFTAQGARSAPALVYGFPGTVLISINDEIVHGIPGARRIKAGDIVKIDVTVEKTGTLPMWRAAWWSSQPAPRLAAWSPARRRRFRRAWPWLVPVSVSTRSAVSWNVKSGGEGFRWSRVSQGTESVERFTRSPRCRTARPLAVGRADGRARVDNRAHDQRWLGARGSRHRRLDSSDEGR